MAANNTPHKGDDLKELVYVLRRMMYMFIRWAEKKYGWNAAD